jgi:membrane fusion protein, heavy metal efflux system
LSFIHEPPFPMKFYRLVSALSLGFVLYACGSGTAVEQAEEVLSKDTSAPAKAEAQTIVFTKEKLATADIQIGKLPMKKLANFVKSTGIIDVPPQNRASLSVPIGGFIKTARLIIGDQVRAGEAIVTLEHPDYIKLQQNYLETKQLLDLSQKEWERQRTLKEGNAGADKNLDKAENTYKTAQISLASLAAQLKLLGINPSKLSPETISSTIVLTAPFDGYITAMSNSIGKYVTPNEVIYEFVNKTHLHLELQVFEKDIHKIRKGQKIKFSLPAWAGKTFEGEVFQIGQTFDTQTKTTNIHAHISNIEDAFKLGMFVEAQIENDISESEALPEEALVEEGGKTYCFVLNQKGEKESIFEKIEIEKGVSQNGFVAVQFSNSSLINKEFVLKGAYYIWAEMNKGGDE